MPAILLRVPASDLIMILKQSGLPIMTHTNFSCRYSMVYPTRNSALPIQIGRRSLSSQIMPLVLGELKPTVALKHRRHVLALGNQPPPECVKPHHLE